MNNAQKLIQLRDRINENLFTKLEAEFPDKNKEFYEICAELAEHSFLAFVSAHLKNQFSIQPFHRLIAEIFEETAKPETIIRRLIVSAPPRSGKSLMTQYYVAWLCGKNEKTSNIFVSYGQRLSTKFMAKVALIMQSDEFKRCFPSFCGFQTGSNTLFKTGGSIFGTSVGGAITGMDAGTLDLIGTFSPGISIIDDPLKSGDSTAKIEALEPYYIDEFSTRRTGNWRQAVIATRFSTNDLHSIVLGLDGIYDSISNPTGWLYLNLAALCKNPETDILQRKFNESLWESHPTLNTAELQKLEKKNLRRFNCVYQGDPTVDDGNLITAAEIQFPQPNLEARNLILCIDAAGNGAVESDNTAFVIAGLDTEKSVVVVDHFAAQLSIFNLRAKITEFTNLHDIREICFENAAMGLTLIPEYETNFNNCNPNNIKITKLSAQIHGNKTRRLQYIQHELKDVKFLNTFQKDYIELRTELLEFPHGKNDDRVDALIWALIRLCQIRPIFEFSEGSNEGEDDWNQAEFTVQSNTLRNHWNHSGNRSDSLTGVQVLKELSSGSALSREFLELLP